MSCDEVSDGGEDIDSRVGFSEVGGAAGEFGLVSDFRGVVGRDEEDRRLIAECDELLVEFEA